MADQVGFGILYHAAMPRWAKLIGLKIKAAPECEGGGFMIDRDQAEAIVKAMEIQRSYIDGWSDAIKQFADKSTDARIMIAKALGCLREADQDLNGVIISPEPPNGG